MLLPRFSHLTVFSNLLTLAFTHPLEDQNEQHTDITIREPRGLSQPSLDHSHLNLQIPTLSRRNIIIGGYQISLFRHVQILPITVAAEDLRQFWTGVQIAVYAKRQTNDHVLPLRFGKLEILFESENQNVPLDWSAIFSLARYLEDNVCTGGGWARFFQGAMTNLATEMVIRVTLRYIGQVF